MSKLIKQKELKMKKYILLLSMFLVTTIMVSQEFNKWAFDIEGGIHSVNDESAVDINTKYYVGAGLRYNFNPTFGLGIRAGYDDLDLRSLESIDVNAKVTRLNLDATVNIFRILDLYSENFTILAHGGPGVAFINDSYKETVVNAQGGLTGLVKLSRNLALKAGYTLAANISQSQTLDGQYANNNYGITSTIHNFSAGLVFYAGKAKEKKEHADWYQYPEAAPTVINNNPTTIVKETITIKEEAVCNCDQGTQSEFVFFDHDKFVIKDTELNAIYKAFAQLNDNPSYTLVIRGFASPTASSIYYNQVLSQNRSEALRKKYELMGLDMSRVTVESYGKDLIKENTYVHDAARRVELIIVKQ
jgi:outer membrane protein OmpA-like peptidoglycan-associated protein